MFSVTGEGLFSFDEDIMPDIERGKLDEKDTTITRNNVEPGSHGLFFCSKIFLFFTNGIRMKLAGVQPVPST